MSQRLRCDADDVRRVARGRGRHLHSLERRDSEPLRASSAQIPHPPGSHEDLAAQVGLIDHHSGIECQHPCQPGTSEPGGSIGAEQQARCPHRRRHAQYRAGLRGIEPSPISGRRSPHRAGDQRGPVFGIGCTQSDQGVTDTSEDRVIRRCFLQETPNPCRACGVGVGQRPAVDHHGQSSRQTLSSTDREQSHGEDVYLHDR